MLESAQNAIISAGKTLDLDEGAIRALLQPNAVHSFEINLKNGQAYPAWRVQHNNKLGPYKGGIRFHPNVTQEEAQGMATLMSFKTAAIGLPLGGGKGGVAVDAKNLSETELEELSRAYVEQLTPYIGPDKDIPAPDVNTSAQIMDWMADEFEKQTGDTTKASFTGKSIENSGSLGRNAATGRGGVIALAELLKLKNKNTQPLTVAIQGFGNVGSFFASIAAEEYPHWKLVAASDSQTALYDPNGLPSSELADFKTAKGRFNDFERPTVERLTNEQLLALDVDVLVLAALEDSITKKNAARIQAHYILELANGPINSAADPILIKKSTVVLPDIIANAGGVIVSYLEWLQNKANKQWSETTVNQKLGDYMTDAVKKNYTMAQKKHISLRQAAYLMALERLVK